MSSRCTELAALLLLLGCPAPADPPGDDDDAADDDDSGTTADDDDAGPDDDDAADDDDPGGPPQGIDLTDGAEVALRFAQVVELRFLLHGNEVGLLAGDGGCPTATATGWQGGCTTAAGFVFAGALSVETAADGVLYTGDGWSVAGSGGPFARIALDGTAEAEEGEASVAYAYAGTFEAVTRDAVAAMRDWTVTGTFTFAGAWPDGGPQEHDFAADVADPDGRAWTAQLSLPVHEAEPCDVYDASAAAVLESGGVVASIDLAGDPDPCDYCWPWSLDGVPQPEPACLTP